MRQGVRHLLERSGAEVLGESSGVRDALTRIVQLRPSLVILDRHLPDGDGVQLCRDIRLVDPRIRCLILADQDDDIALLQSLKAGADGHLLKKIPSEDLAAAVRRVALGQSLFSAELHRRARVDVEPTPSLRPDLAGLSSQEQKVLAFLAEGMTNRQIAHHMYLAEKTVRNYVSIVLAKLGFERRTQAAIFAARSPGSAPEPRL
jgi:two-component system response regulator DevR